MGNTKSGCFGAVLFLEGLAIVFLAALLSFCGETGSV